MNGYDTETSLKMNGIVGYAIVDIIKKKRDGETLDRGEIDYFINGAVSKYITDAQIGNNLKHFLLVSTEFLD